MPGLLPFEMKNRLVCHFVCSSIEVIVKILVKWKGDEAGIAENAILLTIRVLRQWVHSSPISQQKKARFFFVFSDRSVVSQYSIIQEENKSNKSFAKVRGEKRVGALLVPLFLFFFVRVCNYQNQLHFTAFSGSSSGRVSITTLHYQL